MRLKNTPPDNIELLEALFGGRAKEDVSAQPISCVSITIIDALPTSHNNDISLKLIGSEVEG